MAETTIKAKIYASTVGRRKEAVAAVRLIAGKGKVTINGVSSAQYFPGLVAATKLQMPFSTLASVKYDAVVSAHGGGLGGQLDAVILGISRALVQIKAENKPALRKLGLVTRDSRTRQRRMVGMGGKSRRRKQSPKR